MSKITSAKLEKIETRAQKLAAVLLKQCGDATERSCPIYELISKNFAERVLFIEGLPKEQLDDVIEACENCRHCKKNHA